jgi:hypothetical protein
MWWRRKQQDFNAEIEAHLQLEADELVSEGLTPSDAQAAARRVFGNRMSAKERFYESTHWMLWDHLVRDVRFALRVLTKDARFSVLAILGLALGIGVSTAIFALINGAAGEADRASVQDPASYVGLYGLVSGRADDISYADFRYYQSQATAFRTMNAESGRFGFVLSPFSIGQTRAEAEDVEGRFESADFLSVIGLRPALGRSFSKEEERMGGPPVAILNFRFWKQHFGADGGILGKTLVLNAHALTIIGVADARFGPADQADFYLPLELQPILFNQGDLLHDPEANWLIADARLRPGVTARQAQAQLDVLWNALHRTRSEASANGGVLVSQGGRQSREAERINRAGCRSR